MAKKRELQGQTAVVTGAAGGIGLAIASELAGRGAHAVLADVLADTGEASAAGLRAQGLSAEAVVCDVTDAAAVAALAADVEARHKRLDWWVNNAGVVTVGDLLDMGDDDWQRMLDVNVHGVVHGVRAAYPRMVARGGGHLLNVASIAGLDVAPGFSIYSGTKHFVVGLSRSLRLEAIEYGVQVHALCPGLVRTPIIDHAAYAGMDRARVVAELLPKLPMADPAVIARDAVNGALRGRAIVISPRSARLLLNSARLLPLVSGGIGRAMMGQLRQARGR